MKPGVKKKSELASPKGALGSVKKTRRKPPHQFEGKGLGTTNKQTAVAVKLSPDIDAIVRSLPNRADFLRAAIAEKLEREGLL